MRAANSAAGSAKVLSPYWPNTSKLTALYQFTGPFVMDSSKSEGLLGLSPTPFEEAVRDTLARWRTEQTTKA